MTKHLVSGMLALSLACLPSVALADGIVKLSPLSSSSPSYSTGDYYDTSSTYGSESIPLRGRISTIPKGTTLMIKLDQPVSSSASRLGDEITATLDNDLYINESLVLPAGSEVVGQVASVVPPLRGGRHGEIDIRFFNAKTPTGVAVPLQAHVVTQDDTGILKGDTYKMDLAKGIGIAAGGTGVGALFGTALGGILGVAGTGAAFGTAVGGIAGLSYALARKGKDVMIPSNTRLSIAVDHSVSVNP
ncbi:MAG: hypothetical protein KTR14_05290 [Vampirovibrio sp.]|nr:hypothetical protein [Vampirovibrio sp.]